MSTLRTALAGLVVLALVPALAGCSDATPTDSGTPSASATAQEPGGGSGDPVAVEAPLDTQKPVDYDRTKATSGTRNEIGERWALDAAGANACAHAEFAFRVPETGGDLGAQVKLLRTTAAKSKSSPLKKAVGALPATPSSTDVEPVLKACTSMGYQL